MGALECRGRNLGEVKVERMGKTIKYTDRRKLGGPSILPCSRFKSRFTEASLRVQRRE